MDDPLNVLGQRLRALGARRVGLAAWLWGEAGIGKTHLGRALLRETPCRSLTIPAALPVPELVRALPRPARLRPWLQAALDALQEGRTVTMDPGEVLAALLAQLAPFVLHLEDLHEADAARLALAAHLAGAAAQTRGVALLVTSRRPAPPSWPAGGVQLSLERLPAGEAGALLEREAGAVLPPEAVAWIFERACGNPLFTVEYFRLLARQGFLWNSGSRWRWRRPDQGLLPVTVEAVIEQVFQGAGLSDAAARLVGVLALSPFRLEGAPLAAITALTPEQLGAAQAEVRRLGLLGATGFAHPLYREVALNRVRPEQRRAWARQAVEVFRDEPQRAISFIGEAGLEASEAAGLLLQAAEVSAEAVPDESSLPESGPPESGLRRARLLTQAVAYTGGETQARLALQAAQALRDTDLAEAQRLAAVAYHGLPGHREATWLYAELLADQGRLGEAEACLADLSGPEQGERGWWARLIGLRGLARSHAGVLELWQARPEWQLPPDPQVMAPVAFAYAASSQLAEAVRLAQAALTLPRLNAPTRCALINVLGTVHYSRQEFGQAVGAYTEATEQARAAGLPHREAMYRHNRAMALGALGPAGAPLADLAETLRLYRVQGRLLQTARTQVVLAGAHLDLGHAEQAEELLLEARDVLARLGPSEYLVECEYRLSVLYRHWAPPHGRLLSLGHGRAALEQARRLAMGGKLAWALCYASIAESCFGEAAEGQRLAEEALALTTRLDSSAVTLAHFAQGFALEAAGRPAEALATFERTEALLRGQGIEDAAQEVGLEADRLSGQVGRAAERLAWFEQAERLTLAQVTYRYFPALRDQAARGPVWDHPREGAPRLRLDVLGEMRFGAPGTAQAVRGRRRRELLACLLEGRLRGRPDLRRAELTATLYPQVPEAQALTALKELVHQTRLALAPALIRTTPGGYALGDLDSDAETFLNTGDVTLWRGPYLAGDVDPPDSLITETLYGALARRAQALLGEQPAEATRLGRLLYEADPYSLPALTLTLQALRASGNHRSLSRFYRAARQELLELGEPLPEDWKTFLEEQHRA